MLDHRLPSLDYKDLLLATQALTKDMREVEKMFRIAVFNVHAHNRDDHAKNFSFLMNSAGRWQASPAYDLTFSTGPAGEHSTTVLGEGKQPTSEQLKHLGRNAGLKPSTTEEIIQRTKETLSNWHDFAEQAGISNASCKYIQTKFTV